MPELDSDRLACACHDHYVVISEVQSCPVLRAIVLNRIAHGGRIYPNVVAGNIREMNK
jgi:hypothetical protein